jgi:hypothetical protein
MLWRSAPPETLMRLNASIATLILAGLALSPATLLARQARHATHKVAPVTPAAKKHTHRETADSAAAKPHSSKRRRRSRSGSEDVPAPVTISRVHASAHNGERQQKIASSDAPSKAIAQATQAADLAPRKATSDDFMRAAAGVSPNPEEADKPATGISHPPDDDEASPRSTTPSPKAATAASTRLATANVSRQIVAEDTAAPAIQPVLYNKRGRLIVPPPLKGSHDILVRQNIVADHEGLDRIKDDDDLDNMRDHGLLVSLPVSRTLDVDDRLPADRRYCRPWTAQFLAALARAHYARFHTPLQVNSAVRTVEFQQRLQRTNGNAAPAEGETASPHLTGQAVDLAKHGLSLTEIAWLRGYLLPLVQQGKIDVEEEFQQACFHISVYKRYLPATTTPRREIASGRRNGTAALAAAMP